MAPRLSVEVSRTYGFNEVIKSPSVSSHNTSSPSSTISEPSNSTLTTKRPRTSCVRKRPNQTYNEAAALLSTAYPNIFLKPNSNNKASTTQGMMEGFLEEKSSDDLFLPFPSDQKPSSPKLVSGFERAWPQSSAGEVIHPVNPGDDDYFDATRHLLDEEIYEEGVIDSIMGNLEHIVDMDETNYQHCFNDHMDSCFYGSKDYTGYNYALMQVDERGTKNSNWWNFFPSIVDVNEISPRLNNNSSNNSVVSNSAEKNNEQKRKKRKVEKPSVTESNNSELVNENSSSSCGNSSQRPNSNSLLLKLNYGKVLNAWSDRSFPFSDDTLPENDYHARLAQIDLFSEEGGLREASVLRYKEKRRTRLISNSRKIRYQVRKVNADQRPRIKGRFVRRPSSNGNGQHEKKKVKKH